MRHLARLAVLGAAVLFPQAARTQGTVPSQVLRTYALSGCVDGPVRYDGYTQVSGRVACLDGTLWLSESFGSPFPSLSLRGSLSATFDPAFTGNAIFVASTEGHFSFTYDQPSPTGPGCVGACVGTIDVQSLGFLAHGTGPSDLRDMRLDATFTYVLPSSPDGGSDHSHSSLFTLTEIPTVSTPEPSTFVLGATGGLLVAALARRRRRTR